jgi:hypothetical protein
MTMPGSLFPRSSSTEPESPSQSTSGEGEDGDRRVRFAADILSPSRTRVSFDDELEQRPSQNSMNLNTHFIMSTSIASSTRKPSFRSRSIPSVKEAVQRFRVVGGEADPSILLPGPNTSPGKMSGKGKAREDGGSTGKHINMGEFTFVEEVDSSYISPCLKGKERPSARNHSLEYLDADTSGENRVRGKERELVAAKKEQRKNERRWERDKDDGDDDMEKERSEREKEKVRDKERIKMLEGEILRLKEEVHNFSHNFLLLL